MPVVSELLCPLPPDGPLESWPALTLLAGMVFGEARGEPHEGQLAVAWSALNRLAAHNRWPSTLHGVLLQPAQYSSLDPKGTAIAKIREPLKVDSAETWFACYKAAAAALFGLRHPVIIKGTVTFFHETAMNPKPAWAATMQPLGVVGKLTFYQG